MFARYSLQFFNRKVIRSAIFHRSDIQMVNEAVASDIVSCHLCLPANELGG